MSGMVHGCRSGAVAQMRKRILRGIALLVAIGAPNATVAQTVQISGISDVGFGTVANFNLDLSQSQTVCAYSSALPARYSISALGSGTGGAFTLSNGAFALPYEVQWNAAAAQTSGTMLSPGTTLTNQTSAAVTPTCTLGLTPSGSLTIVLRAAALSRAQAGAFTGTLTLLISPN